MTLNSNSARSVKQRALFTRLKICAEQFAARDIMHEAEENHMRKEIKRIMDQSKRDTRRINTTAV